MKALDDNARLMNGTLPADPFDDAVPFEPPPDSTARRPAAGRATAANDDAPKSEPRSAGPQARAEEARARAQRGPGRASPTWKERLITVDDTWLAHPLPPREYLLTDERTGLGAWPTRGVAVIGAAGGVGKSYATLGLAVAIATGTLWLGVFRPAAPGRVLIVSAEDPADEIRRRIYDIARSAGIRSIPDGAIDVIDVHDRHMPLLDADATPTEQAHSLATLAGQRGPYALSIVDPLARVSGASIDADNVAACSLVTALEVVVTAALGLVMGVHHTGQTARQNGRTDATALRGATGLGDSARLVAIMTAEDVPVGDTPGWADLGQIVTMTVAKCNHVRRWDPVQLRRGEHGELLPLDAGAGEIIGRARRASDPAARKREQREAGREAQEERDAAKQTARAAEQAAQAAAKEHALRSAVVASVAAQPGLGLRQLTIAMRARRATGQDDTLRAAVEAARLSGDIVTSSGKGKTTHHWLPEQGTDEGGGGASENPPTPPCIHADADTPGMGVSGPVATDKDTPDTDTPDTPSPGTEWRS